MTGLASGLVETLREIGVGAVSTALAAHAGEIARASNPTSRELAAVHAFHSAFWVMFVVAALGAPTAAIAFPRHTARDTELQQVPSLFSIIPEPTES